MKSAEPSIPKLMDPAAIDFLPLSLNRSVAGFPIGNRPLAVHHAMAGLPPDLDVDPRAWLAPRDLEDFLKGGCASMIDSAGGIIASFPQAGERAGCMTASDSFLIRYPWDLIRANEQWVGALTESVIEGDVHPSAVVEGIVHIGPGTRILPGVFIEGNVVIGANCKIGPNCYLRGNTAIGDHCHIGQSVEIKNCLILSRTSVGHLSYVGDSVLGEGVNFGAGTTVSNLRHDGKNHRSMVHGLLIDTGRRKFGCIVGDGVHTGIHTSIYPGRKLWPGTSTRPGEIIQQDVLS